jgi:hypothetical protein
LFSDVPAPAAGARRNRCANHAITARSSIRAARTLRYALASYAFYGADA